MAGPVVAVVFEKGTYLMSRVDFDKRPYPNSGTQFVLYNQDVKLVPITGGEAVTVGELMGDKTQIVLNWLQLGPTLPGGVNPVLKQYEDTYWNAIAKSQDPKHQAERMQDAKKINFQVLSNLNQGNNQLNIQNQNNTQQNKTCESMRAMCLKYYGVNNLLTNCVSALEAKTQYYGSQRYSSQNYDNVIQCMENVIADQEQFHFDRKKTFDAESRQYFKKLKGAVTEVRNSAIWYLSVKLSKRGVRLQEGPNLLSNAQSWNVSLNQLDKSTLEQAGLGDYDISRMLAMKDVVSKMEKSIRLCEEALDERIHEQRSLGEFYDTQVRKQMCVPIQSNDPYSAPGVRQFQEFIPNFAPAPQINPFFVPFLGMMSHGRSAPLPQMNYQFFGPGMNPFLRSPQMGMGGPMQMRGFTNC